MKNIIKKCSFITIIFFAVLLFNKVDAATCNVSANKTNIQVGEQVSVSVNVNAGAWNLRINGGGLTSGDTSGLVGQTNTTANSNASKTYTFTANSAGTYTISVTGDITDYDTDQPINISKPITITVSEKKQEQPVTPTEPTTPTQPTAPTFSNTNKKMYATDKINLRSSWSTSSAATSVEKGTELTVTGTSTEKINGYVWYRVSYNGTKYVASGLLTATKPQVEENKEDENKEKSSNKALKDLVVQNYKLSPEFTSENTKYTLEVTKEVDKLEITPIPEDSEAKVQIAGNENFKIGNNIVKITVTAEDGTTRIYTITVTKTNQSGNEEEGNTLKLKSLQIKEGTLSPSFDPETTNYTVEVSDPASININEFITAIAEDEDVEVTIAESKQSESGNRVITIMLENSDGTKSGVYQITLKKSAIIPVGNLKQDIFKNNKIYFILGGIIAILLIAIIVVIILLKKTSKDAEIEDVQDADELDDNYDYSLKNAIDQANSDENNTSEFDEMVENSGVKSQILSQNSDFDDEDDNTEYNVFQNDDEDLGNNDETKRYKMSDEITESKNKKKGKHF